LYMEAHSYDALKVGESTPATATVLILC